MYDAMMILNNFQRGNYREAIFCFEESKQDYISITKSMKKCLLKEENETN